MAFIHKLAGALAAGGGSAGEDGRSITQFPWPAQVGGFVSGYGTRGYQGYQAAGQVEQSLQVIAVQACIRAISDAVSTLPLNVYDEDKDRAKASPRDPQVKLITRRPHPRLPAGEFYGLTAAHLAGWGNAFIFKGRANGVGGPVTSLFPILPSMVGVTLLEDGSPEYRVTLINGDRVVTREDIIHIRSFGIDGIVGLSPIGLARKAIESQELEEDYRINLLANDARVSGLLSTDQELTPDAAKRLAMNWKAAHGGPGKAGGTAVLEGGMKWQQLSLSTEDMQFIEQRQYSVAEIARLFRVPPSIINAETAGSLTYSTTESEGLALVRDCLMPYLRRIEQAFDHDPELLPDRQCPEFDVDGLLRADALTRAQRTQILVASKVMTPNEGRAVENLAPLPELDEPVTTPAPVAPMTPAPADTDPEDAPSPEPPGGNQ